MQILGKNIVLKAGEIDILAQDTDKTIVLVEVKALSGKGVLDPESKLGPIKRKKLHLLARILEARYPGQNIRVDAIALYWKSGVAQINHYKNIIT